MQFTSFLLNTMATRRPRQRRRRAKRRTLSAGVIPVRYAGGERLYLMLRAFQYWDFPKGKVEPGEEPLDAACREVKEEAGITDLSFCWGFDFFETGPYAQGKVARYYIGRTETQRVTLGINPELGRPEHHEHRWVTDSEAFDLASPRVQEVLEWAEQLLGGN